MPVDTAWPVLKHLIMIFGIEAPSLPWNKSRTLARRFASAYSTVDRASTR